MPDPKLVAWRDQSTIDAEQAAADAEQQRLNNLRADTLTQQMIDQLKVATPTSISTYVENNVTDLASQKTMNKRILLVLATLLRE